MKVFSGLNVSVDTRARKLDHQKRDSSLTSKTPLQRKTTLKWGSDGELSSIDMARILEKLDGTELTECDLSCGIDQ